MMTKMRQFAIEMLKLMLVAVVILGMFMFILIICNTIACPTMKHTTEQKDNKPKQEQFQEPKRYDIII